MPQTRTALKTAVLQHLQAAYVGDAGSTEDLALVEARLDPILADLAARRIASVAVGDTTFADNIYQHLVVIVAERLAPEFGRPANADAIAAAEAALVTVARLAATGLALSVIEQVKLLGGDVATLDVTTVTNRLQGYLDDLAGRDVITIANAASVPSKATADVARYIAAWLLPTPNADVIAAAEARLRTLARFGGAVSGTSAKLIADVLRSLGVIAFGEAPTAAQSAFVSTILDDTLEDLAARNVIYISDASSIEAKHVSALRGYLTAICGPMTSPPRPLDETARLVAERQLRTISRIGSGTGGALTVDQALRPSRRGSWDFSRG